MRDALLGLGNLIGGVLGFLISLLLLLGFLDTLAQTLLGKLNRRRILIFRLHQVLERQLRALRLGGQALLSLFGLPLLARREFLCVGFLAQRAFEFGDAVGLCLEFLSGRPQR